MPSDRSRARRATRAKRRGISLGKATRTARTQRGIAKRRAEKQLVANKRPSRGTKRVAKPKTGGQSRTGGQTLANVQTLRRQSKVRQSVARKQSLRRLPPRLI